MRFPASLAGAVLLLGRAACAQVAMPGPAGLGRRSCTSPPRRLSNWRRTSWWRGGNEMMAKVKTAATGAPGVRTSFRDYAVIYSEVKPPHWTAQQTVEVRGGDGEALLDLLGRLQAPGLALGNLGWEVSAGRAEQAQQDATLKGLATLRKQATEAARALGMEVDHFQSVSLNNAPGVVPMGRPQMARAPPMMAPMPPPNASPESQDVIASVSGDVVLAMPARAP